MLRTIWLCVGLLTTTFAVSAFAADRSLTVTGKVLDASGAPVSGATVYAAVYGEVRDPEPNPKPTIREARSGAGGSFRVTIPAPGENWWGTVAALKDGHGPGGMYLSSTEGKTADLMITLTRPGFVAGKVVDRAGRPVPGAKVAVQYAMVQNEGAVLPPREARPDVTTDAQGRFRIAPLPAQAQLGLSAEHPNHARWRAIRERISSGTEDVTIVLPPPGAITGRVIGEDGKPAANVTVRCRGMWDVSPIGTTDASGSFRFGSLAGDHYVLTVRPSQDGTDLSAEPQGVLLKEGTEERCPDLRLTRLARAGMVAGKVTDEKGQPLAGVRINATREFRFPMMVTYVEGPTTQTAADGTYRLRMPPGKWRLQLGSFPRGYASTLEWDQYPQPEVAADQTAPVDFTLVRTVPLRGRVLDANGRPAAGAKLQVQPVSRRMGGWQRATADAQGEFGLRGVLPNEAVEISVFSLDRTQGAIQEVTPRPESAELAIRLQRLPAVTGTVTDEKGAPVADASVSLEQILSGGPMGGITMRRMGGTTSDGRGQFSLPVFSDEQYRLSVQANGFATTDRFPVGIEAGKPAAPLTVALQRADGFIAGTVVDPEDRPLGGVRVSAMRQGATRFYLETPETTTDAQGRFHLAQLPPGEVQVSAQMAGYHPEFQRQVKVGSKSVRLMLAPSAEAAPRPAPPRVAVPAPDIQVARWINGTGVKSLKELRDKTVVLQFSSAYNSAAPASNQALKALHARLKETGRTDVVLLAVYDASASPDEVAEYARAEGLPFPIGIVEETRNLGADSAAFKAYGVRRLPAVFIIDKQGILRAVDPAREELHRILASEGRKPDEK